MKRALALKRWMIILFILTLCCLYFALITLNMVNEINPQPGFRFVRNNWVFWCWLPIPIASIILGFRYQRIGLPCKKNIIGGFIIGFLLLIYGSFCLLYPFGEQSYSRLDPYRSVIDANLPDRGEIEIQEWGTYFDDDKTEYVVILADYSKEDVENLERSISGSSHWVPCDSFRTELKALMPSTLRSDQDAWFSVYNKTTGEYNTLPSESGSYEIYAMRYDKSDKQLEIHRYVIAFVE